MTVGINNLTIITDGTGEQMEVVNTSENTGRDNLGRFALLMESGASVKREAVKLTKLEAARQDSINRNREYALAHGDDPELSFSLWA